ncbi:hypothetical protein HA402_015960 [Bradysia odoriphaga]|nr:hypothetical protein HA402_015960 [Bradysia odoriphaga]
MSEEYIVHYFDIRGRAEPIRMILSYAGAKWKDQRIPSAIPAEIKAVATYGQVPVLEVNGKYLAQTLSICRYLARKLNLTGANEWEAAKCDEIVDGVDEFAHAFGPAWVEQDPAKKKEIIDNALKTGQEKIISRFNTMLQTNGGHFVGSNITWADIVTACTIDFNEKLWNISVTEGYPAVKKLLDTVFSANGIKEWIAKRPVTKM